MKANEVAEGEVIDSHSGEALSLLEADSLARGVPVRVVVLAGPAESGKTTLIAGLYEAFRRGPFAGTIFSESRSLVGLEERCHLSRLVSGRHQPDTYRTHLQDERSLVHLAVREETLFGPTIHFLFADISGEHFRTLRDSGEPGSAGPMLAAAADVAFMLDGARLVHPRKRFQCVNDIRTLIRVCDEKELVKGAGATQLVVTKWDLVASAEASAQEWVRTQIDDLGEDLSGRTGSGTVHCTAMRHGGDVNRDHGLAELFGVWTSDRPAKRYVRYQPLERRGRQSYRFGLSL